MLRPSLHADVVEDVAEVHAGEESRRETGSTPVEAEGLADDVLLFSSVAGADERDGESDRRTSAAETGLQVEESESGRLLDEAAKNVSFSNDPTRDASSPGNVELPASSVLCRYSRNGAVVSNVEERRRSEEAGFEECSQGCFAVCIIRQQRITLTQRRERTEGVLAGQSDETLVALDPLVRRALVVLVHFRRDFQMLFRKRWKVRRQSRRRDDLLTGLKK